MYAAAKQGHLPSCFSCVNFATDSPRVAIVAQVFMKEFLFLKQIFSQRWQWGFPLLAI
jgi:amino acid transporter